MPFFKLLYFGIQYGNIGGSKAPPTYTWKFYILK